MAKVAEERRLRRKKMARPLSTGRKRNLWSGVCLRPEAKVDEISTDSITAEDLSEEDQQLKSELDILVERLMVWDRATIFWPSATNILTLGT
jgi:hypothetical protein